jgi:hypothetical protein
LNPKWKNLVLNLSEINTNYEEESFTIEVYSNIAPKKDKYLGKLSFNIKDVLNDKIIVPIINEEAKSKNKRYKNSGNVLINKLEIKKKDVMKENETYHSIVKKIEIEKEKEQIIEKAKVDHTFFEFIHNGLDLKLKCIVNFTSSNGDPTKKESNHYINLTDNNSLNPYQDCLKNIIAELTQYDENNEVDCYGYGASVNGTMLPYFNLSLTEDSLVSSSNVLRIYNKCALKVKYSEMTSVKNNYGSYYYEDDFYHIIESTSEKSQPTQKNQFYIIYLILMNGDTIDVI